MPANPFASIGLSCVLAGLIAILAGCQRQTDGLAGSAQDSAIARNESGKQVSPDSKGFDNSALMEMAQSIKSGDWGNIHAVLIQHHDELVYESYYPGEDERMGKPQGRIEFDVSTTHDVRSVTKSIVSLLVGIALDQELIASVIIDNRIRNRSTDRRPQGG